MAEKKKKKGGGGGKKKKQGENVYEALLEYKISVIEKELEEWRFRIHKLQEENEELNGRDAHLREECEATMKGLVVDALQFDKDNISYPKIGKEDVHAILHEKISAAAEQEAELGEVHNQMFQVEIDIFKVRSQIKHWIQYRDVTRIKEQQAIESLEREVAYMLDNYNVLSNYLEKTTRDERSALTQLTEDKIEQKTRKVTERVAMGLDRYTRKMLSENEYMRRELATREQEVAELENYVRALEESNLTITEKLNVAHMVDSTAHTNVFMTELFSNDKATNFTTNSLLNVDLSQLAVGSDASETTFEQLLSQLDQNSPRLPTIEDEDTLVSPLASLHVEGTQIRVKPPPVLSEEEQKCLDFKGPTWIDTPRLKQALRLA